MENTNSEKYDYVIIGAGCAGLASAQYAARGGLSVLVLDLAGAGGQVLQISELENYPGVFPAVDGATYMMTMQKQAEAFGAKIVQENVLSIDKLGADFIVKTKKASYQASCLCLATGAIHRNLDVPGEKELTGRGVSYCATCDGPFFRDKKILVVGGGDSACSEAIYLSTISKDVSIIHRRDKFRAQQAVIDKMLAAGVKPVYDSVVKEIKGEGRVQSVILGNVKTGEQTEVEADAVFIFTGMLPQTDLVEMLPKDPSGYILTDENMETSVPGLFAAGDVRSKPFRQVVTSVSDGAIAAHVASERIRNA
jgi:thioredoxin reductase (NADPH)